MTNWSATLRRRRAQRAGARNLDYQFHKAAALRGREDEAVQMMQGFSHYVEGLIEPHAKVAGARVLEVGSGAHGLVFYFNPASWRVGIDPAAVDYAALFSQWQRRADTVAACGETLPFADAAFDIVLSHNVIDHAENPGAILTEMARVLKPGGVLYFTVNVHHWMYHLASRMHATWTALGIPFEIGDFANHTVHLTPDRVKQMIRALPLRAVMEKVDFERTRDRKTYTRPIRARVDRLFFRNALYELVAIRQ